MAEIPEIVGEHDRAVRLRMTPRLACILSNHRFFFGDKRMDQMPTFELDKSAVVEPYSSIFNGSLVHSIGLYSYSFSELGRFGIRIGRYCSIAGGVYCMGGSHPMDRVTSSNLTFEGHQPHHIAAWTDLFGGKRFGSPFHNTYRAPQIEHDVWIGDKAQLREGVTLGTGCVIGSAAVVSKDVPPYAVVVGNPAVIKKFRFPHIIIARLLASRWWEYHPRVLFEFGHEDVEGFLSKFEAAKDAGHLERFAPRPLTWDWLRCQLDSAA